MQFRYEYFGCNYAFARKLAKLISIFLFRNFEDLIRW